MRKRFFVVLVSCLAFGVWPATARAQYKPGVSSDRATGENYHVEFGLYFWDPAPDMTIQSEALGIPGDPIDFVKDLGVEQSTFRQMKLVLRPATKHKFRYEYTPITYTATGSLRAAVRFNGIRYPVTLPVATDFSWKAQRFGYEYDMIYRDRGFFGILLEAKYTNVETTLSNAIDTEFVSAKAPIPAIGAIGRVYVVPNISVTGEFSGFPGGIVTKFDDDSDGHYFDFDLYGSVNITDHFGGQVGYRKLNVFYEVNKKDTGQFDLQGWYFGGVVRF